MILHLYLIWPIPKEAISIFPLCDLLKDAAHISFLPNSMKSGISVIKHHSSHFTFCELITNRSCKKKKKKVIYTGYILIWQSKKVYHSILFICNL